MKNIKYIGFISLVGFLFVGCSGKVQTNPITDDNKYNLPNAKKFTFDNNISEHYIIDFQNFANAKLKDENYVSQDILEKKQNIYNTNNENKLWNIGYKKANQ